MDNDGTMARLVFFINKLSLDARFDDLSEERKRMYFAISRPEEGLFAIPSMMVLLHGLLKIILANVMCTEEKSIEGFQLLKIV